MADGARAAQEEQEGLQALKRAKLEAIDKLLSPVASSLHSVSESCLDAVGEQRRELVGGRIPSQQSLSLVTSDA